MNSNGRKAFNSGVWFTLSNFLMKTIGFITTPIFTRLMTKSEFGDFNNFQTWLMIFLYITSLNLEGSLIRAVHEFKEESEKYISSMIILSMLSTCVCFFVTNIFIEYISEFTAIDRTYINCMFLYLLFAPAVTLFQNYERFKYKYKWTVVSSLIVSVGSSLLSVLLVVLFKDKLCARIIGYIIPTMILGFVISIRFLYHTKGFSLKYWKYAMPITLPYIPHLLSMYLLSNMDRVMIRYTLGAEAVALYSLAYTCGMIITVLVTSVNSAFAPWLAERLQEKKYNEIKKISVPYVALFSFFAFCAVLITPELLLVMGGNSYYEARYVMPPVAAGCLLQFVYCMYVNIEQFEKKTVGMAFASAFAAVLNYILNSVFIPKYAYVAAAYTTYISYFALLIIHMCVVKRIGMIHVYNNLIIFVIATLASALIFCTNFVLDIHFVRYIILIILGVVSMYLIFKNTNRLLSLRKG